MQMGSTGKRIEKKARTQGEANPPPGERSKSSCRGANFQAARRKFIKMIERNRSVNREKMKQIVSKTLAIVIRIALIVLLAYMAFFCYVAVHEWAGHILSDELVFARHGTTLARFEVIVQWLSVSLEDGRWNAGRVPLLIGGEVVSAIPADPITLSDWEIGFGNFMGSGITALISLVALAFLSFRKDLPRFPWFAGFFSLYSVVFDQILYTSGNPADALDGAVRMGTDPLLFKILVTGLVLLQGWLLVRIGFRYRRIVQPRAVLSEQT